MIILGKKMPMLYSALLLTAVNLLMRLVGTAFGVYLSGRIGAEGIGLLQLVMSVSGLATIAGMAGIRTATMYLTANQIGKHGTSGLKWVLSACISYSLICSSIVSIALYFLAPNIATQWIGHPETVNAIRTISLFLPVICLTGVMTGYFIGAKRIGILTAVELCEQLICISLTLLFLMFAGSDPGKCCQSVAFGSGFASCLALLSLTILRLAEKQLASPKFKIGKELRQTALPLALADDLKAGISTTENMIVPKRLALFAGLASPLAAFGIISGMVFPILMFPACILYGLSDLLIPELAHCHATGNKSRIEHLTAKSLKAAALYGLTISGLVFLLAEPLCLQLYNNAEAGKQLSLYAILIPMLYCDAIVDATTKGLGQQKICVRYNIITSLLDVVFLYILLPKYGMAGYFVSFTITHLINFLLSLRRLTKISRLSIPVYQACLGIGAGIAATWLCAFLQNTPAKVILFPVVLFSMLTLLNIVGFGDLLWLKGLLFPTKNIPLPKGKRM